MTALKKTIKKYEKARPKEDKELVERKMYELLGKIFSQGQIRMILNPSLCKMKWSSEDITHAISLRCVSPKAYRYMKHVLQIPLPGLSTLRRWASTIDVESGILFSVLHCMIARKKSMLDIERLVVLTFDEIYINDKIAIDRKLEKVIGPHKTCQCVMVRSLFASWKQLVYYEFDKTMDATTLNNIILKLHDAGYIVVAITSDLGPGNLKLWSQLEIGMHPQKSYFQHPARNDLKVFVFADAPHLLKLLRNHFLDKGFIWKGKIVDKEILFKLLSINAGDLKISHKITTYHLNVQGSERQKVLPAAQVLSNTIASAIEWCGRKSYLLDLPYQEAAYVIRLCNDWFDVFNAKCKYGKHTGKNAYGINIEEQNVILNNMMSFINETRIGKHKTLLPFQKGILVSIASLQQLLLYLQEQYSTSDFPITYLITYRLNQDLLENLFSFLRSIGCANDHPTPLDFKYRLKRYILGKHSRYALSNECNVQENKSNEPIFVSPLNCDIDDSMLTDILSSYVEEENTTVTYSYEEEELCIGEASYENCITLDPCAIISSDEEQLLQALEDFNVHEIINEEGLKYIAGYVAFRFKSKDKTLGIETRQLETTYDSDWLQFISRGKCMYPSDKLLQCAHIMNIEFDKYHGSSLNKENFIFQTLAKIIQPKLKIKISEEVLLCLIRTRTYIRVREINRTIASKNHRRKQKKISKYTNTKSVS